MVPAQADGSIPGPGALGQEAEGVEIPVQVGLGCPRPPVSSTQVPGAGGRRAQTAAALRQLTVMPGTQLCAGGYKAALSVPTERSR